MKTKNTIVKILTALMAVSVLAFSGAGCGNKNDTNASSTQSTASAASKTSAEESKKDESKKDESKKDESKKDESKTEKSNSEASEESSKKSDESGTESSTEEAQTEADTMTKEMMVGTWEYNVGSAYMGLQLLDSGSAFIKAGEIENTMIGSWDVEDNKLKLTYFGESTYYVLKDGVLYSVDHPSQFFTKKSDTTDAKVTEETPSEADTMTAEMMVGTWEYNVGSSFMGLQLLDNGSAFISANELANTMVGSWTVEDNKLKLTYFGESSYYVLESGVLYSVDHPSQFFTKKSDSTDTKVNEETPSEADTMTEEMMLGTWEYNVGSEFMGIQLLDNGNAFIRVGEIDKTMIGTWAIEDNKLKLTYWGESSYYVLDNGILYSAEYPSHFYTKKSN